MASRATDQRLAGAQPQLGMGGNVVGMEPWTEVELETPHGSTVKVTAVHAQHGPDGSDEIQGPVLGFLLSAPGAEEI